MNPETTLINLAQQHFQSSRIDLKLLKGDGSDRKIFLVTDLSNPQRIAVGVYHTNLKENQDFILITGKMKEAGIPVPELYLVDPGQQVYLLQYLGKYNLGECIDHWLLQSQQAKIIQAYQKVLPYLIKIQNGVTPLLSGFLKQRVMARSDFVGDLEYFKRDFIHRFGYNKFLNSAVSRELTENLLERITELPPTVFVYRDFQSRNIMWRHDNPWFIDYQSAFLGSCYYDLASLLFASKAGLDDPAREVLLSDYYRLAGLKIGYDEFSSVFYLFVLIRRLRSLGVYGFLSMEKGKSGFLDSVEPSLVELKYLLSRKAQLSDFPHTLNMITVLLERWQFELSSR